LSIKSHYVSYVFCALAWTRTLTPISTEAATTITMAATISEIISSDSPPAKSRFLEDKKILRRILDDPKATHRAITEAVRTDAELNVSLLKIGVEGIMFNKFALQSHQSRAKQYDREQQLFVDRESNSL